MDPVAGVLLALIVILVAGRVGGGVAERVGQAAVIGELLAGVVLGNFYGPGGEWLRSLKTNEMVTLFASLGAIILLFEVGLESTLREMLRVGPRSLLVAVLGVCVPWALGWWVGALLLPDRSAYVHAFLGATLTATSVGITARVLKDLGQSQTAEARVIIGAAVIDDVLGLVILAVVGSVIAAANLGVSLSLGGAGLVLGKALGFLLAAFAIGAFVSPRLFALVSRLPGRGALLTTALVFCFILAYFASAVGLAAIVGAYAAGLILEESHYKDFNDNKGHRLEEMVHPISVFMVPTFFVMMGMHVDLTAILHPEALGLALLLTAAAVVGKQACALGAFGGSLDPVSIGLGMIPRGEVGLIFANIGLGLTVHGERIVDESIFAAVVVAVMVTTLVAPSMLKWRLSNKVRAIVPDGVVIS